MPRILSIESEAHRFRGPKIVYPMDGHCSHLKEVICNVSWSIECNTEFVRQKVKPRKTTSSPSTLEDGAPGELLRQFVKNFGFKPGWHLVGKAPKLVYVQVA